MYCGFNPKNKLILKLILYIFLCSVIITLIITGIQLYLNYQSEIASIKERSQHIEKSYFACFDKSVMGGRF